MKRDKQALTVSANHEAPTALVFAKPTDKSENEAIAELRMSPFLRHGSMANTIAAVTVKFPGDVTGLDASGALKTISDTVAGGNLRHVSDTLLAQSISLDTTMTEMMRKAWANAAEYPLAFDRYMALAMKAQAQSRATMEALAKMHQPREQVVRHVHVYEGGQAVVAEEIHHHAQGIEHGNAGIAHQPHAARAGRARQRAALPCPDPFRNGMPCPSGTGQEAVPAARRCQGKRRADRQQQRPEARDENPRDDRASADAEGHGDPA